MALDPNTVEPAYGKHKVAAIDNELKELEARTSVLKDQRVLYAPAAKKYDAAMKKATATKKATAADDSAASTD